MGNNIVDKKRVQYMYLPTSPYDRNLLTDVSESPVIGPVVSSDLITSRKGPKNEPGSISPNSKSTCTMNKV